MISTNSINGINDILADPSNLYYVDTYILDKLYFALGAHLQERELMLLEEEEANE